MPGSFDGFEQLIVKPIEKQPIQIKTKKWVIQLQLASNRPESWEELSVLVERNLCNDVVSAIQKFNSRQDGQSVSLLEMKKDQRYFMLGMELKFGAEPQRSLGSTISKWLYKEYEWEKLTKTSGRLFQLIVNRYQDRNDTEELKMPLTNPASCIDYATYHSLIGADLQLMQNLDESHEITFGRYEDRAHLHEKKPRTAESVVGHLTVYGGRLHYSNSVTRGTVKNITEHPVVKRVFNVLSSPPQGYFHNHSFITECKKIEPKDVNSVTKLLI